jgi:methyl-accepting chemotaxis protein
MALKNKNKSHSFGSVRVIAVKNWKIRTHLLLLVASLLTGLFAAGWLGISGMKSSADGLQTVYEDRVVPLRDLKQIADLYAVNIVDAVHKARSGENTSQTTLRDIEHAQVRIEQIWEAYLKTVLVADETRLIQQIKPLMSQARQPLDELKTLLARNDTAGIEQFARAKLYRLIDPLSEKFAALIDVQLVEAERQYDLGGSTFSNNMTLIVAIWMLALLIGGTQAYFFARLLNRQLGAEPSELEALSTSIAAGQLGGSHSSVSHIVTGVMKSVQGMRSALKDMIGNIGETSEQIESATLQLAASSAQVLRNTSIQSDTASTMAATVQELTVSISHIADNAQQTQRIAIKAGSLSDEGIQVMEAVSAEMQTIAALVTQSSSDVELLAGQSRNISAIVDVIRGIAEQTNLLALNAAIEAARAGEQGRGFAVVADEVRSLAGRTAQSTTEIVSLVTAIQIGTQKAQDSMAAGRERVSNGTRLVEQASISIADIRHALNESVEAVNNISTALQEQRLASEYVAASVERVARIVGENSEAQGGIVNASQALQGMSERLQKVISRFSF